LHEQGGKNTVLLVRKLGGKKKGLRRQDRNNGTSSGYKGKKTRFSRSHLEGKKENYGEEGKSTGKKQTKGKFENQEIRSLRTEMGGDWMGLEAELNLHTGLKAYHLSHGNNGLGEVRMGSLVKSKGIWFVI